MLTNKKINIFSFNKADPKRRVLVGNTPQEMICGKSTQRLFNGRLEVINICIKDGLSTEEELGKYCDLNFMISELSELLTILI